MSCFGSVGLSIISPFHLFFLLLLLPWIGFDNLLLLLKARSPLGNSATCLSGHISMEDLQSQRSTSMDWLSKFTGLSTFTLQTTDHPLPKEIPLPQYLKQCTIRLLTKTTMCIVFCIHLTITFIQSYYLGYMSINISGHEG